MKKYIILFAFIFVFLGFNATVSKTVFASDCAINSTLRVSSTGDEVACLQTYLNISADGHFGPMTRAAVMAWQASHGLVGDGVFGPRSRASFIANGGVSGNFPPGCQSASGYSATTGLPCRPISNSQSPVISGVSGPQSLRVNQEGTWTVTTSSPNIGNLSYSVAWGDEVAFAYGANLSTNPSAQQSATFTHSYAQAGIYNPTFTVTNGSGSAKTSLSVNVGGSTITNSLQIIPGSATVPVGKTTTFQARFDNCPPGAMCFVGPLPVVATWTSSNTKIATVTYKNSCPGTTNCLYLASDYLTAVVTGVSLGTATITATYKEFTTTAQVTVGIPEISSSPTISSLTPSYGVVGREVIIHGTGLSVYTNTISFGSGAIPNVISADGTTLRFNVPSTISPTCRFSNPPCYIAERMTTPGNYSVAVTNTNGTSNAVIFTVTAASAAGCEYPNPSPGYHWEGIQPYPICGGYLVADPGGAIIY